MEGADTFKTRSLQTMMAALTSLRPDHEMAVADTEVMATEERARIKDDVLARRRAEAEQGSLRKVVAGAVAGAITLSPAVAGGEPCGSSTSSIRMADVGGKTIVIINCEDTNKITTIVDSDPDKKPAEPVAEAKKGGKTRGKPREVTPDVVIPKTAHSPGTFYHKQGLADSVNPTAALAKQMLPDGRPAFVLEAATDKVERFAITGAKGGTSVSIEVFVSLRKGTLEAITKHPADSIDGWAVVYKTFSGSVERNGGAIDGSEEKVQATPVVDLTRMPHAPFKEFKDDDGKSFKPKQYENAFTHGIRSGVLMIVPEGVTKELGVYHHPHLKTLVTVNAGQLTGTPPVIAALQEDKPFHDWRLALANPQTGTWSNAINLIPPGGTGEYGFLHAMPEGLNGPAATDEAKNNEGKAKTLPVTIKKHRNNTTHKGEDKADESDIFIKQGERGANNAIEIYYGPVKLNTLYNFGPELRWPRLRNTDPNVPASALVHMMTKTSSNAAVHNPKVEITKMPDGLTSRDSNWKCQADRITRGSPGGGAQIVQEARWNIYCVLKTLNGEQVLVGAARTRIFTNELKAPGTANDPSRELRVRLTPSPF